MKTGRTLTELAQEIERQSTAKRDYLVNTTTALRMEPSPAGVQLVVSGGEGGDLGLAVNDLAHEQLGEWAGIPRAYYRRMQEQQPDLLAKNVNTWFEAAEPKTRTRMLRTLDGKVRAFVSNGYRPMDYYQLAEAVLPVLVGLELDVISCELTERRLYFKAVDKSIRLDCPTGRRMGDGSHVFFDTLSPAIVISNSEVGCGSLSVETGVWTRVCTNLAIASQRSLKKYHLGARADLGEDIMALLSDDTRTKTDAALWAQVRDVVAAAFDEAKFAAYVIEIGAAAENRIEGDPVKVVEITAKRHGLNETERTGVLQHLIRGGDLTQYGLAAAVTRTAEDLPDYDRATEFERLGGKLIELPRTEWKALAKAA